MQLLEKKVRFGASVPILRIDDIVKTREFYLGFLGFCVDWEHRFYADAPLYMQVSRAKLVLHLSQHRGDGNPGLRIRIPVDGIDDFHAELAAKSCEFTPPGVAHESWGERSMTIIDPIGNHLVFYEPDNAVH